MPYADKEKQKQRTLELKQGIYQRRRDILSSWPCLLCGDPDDSVIQWHHVYPEDKEFNVTRGLTSEDRWWNEVMKCIPVCANCHTKIHKEKLCLISPIGSRPL